MTHPRRHFPPLTQLTRSTTIYILFTKKKSSFASTYKQKLLYVFVVYRHYPRETYGNSRAETYEQMPVTATTAVRFMVYLIIYNYFIL